MTSEHWAAYCGPPPSPASLWTQWNVDVIVATLAVSAAVAFVVLRRRQGFRPWRFTGGVGVLFVVFVSPLCALSTSLFAARVVHHLFLVLLAAPLLVASICKSASPKGGPLSWTLLQAFVLWFWHAPAAYEAALSNSIVYWFMQATLGGVAFGFWRAVYRSPAPAAVSALLLAMVPMGLLGAVLTLSPTAFYAPHLLTTAPWGLSPNADQQLGGLIMWAPAAATYLVVALALFSRELRNPVGQS